VGIFEIGSATCEIPGCTIVGDFCAACESTETDASANAVSSIVTVLGRISEVDREAHGVWYEVIAAGGESGEDDKSVTASVMSSPEAAGAHEMRSGKD